MKQKLTRITKANTSLRMTSQSPLDAGIYKHFCRVFTGECTKAFLEADILQ